MTSGSPDLVSPEDVRQAVFTESRRGGFDRDEVHAFLDRVILTLEELGRRLRTARQNSGGTAAEPALHDPDRAAQRLLAAAQRTADMVVHDAEAQATAVSTEAEQYAERVRRDADSYQTSVLSQADEQAARIRTIAVEEARADAEKTRATLVDEISDLEALRDLLRSDRDSLEAHLDTERSRLRSVVATLTTAIEASGGSLFLEPGPEVSEASLASVPPPAALEADDAWLSDTGATSVFSIDTTEPPAALSLDEDLDPTISATKPIAGGFFDEDDAEDDLGELRDGDGDLFGADDADDLAEHPADDDLEDDLDEDDLEDLDDLDDTYDEDDDLDDDDEADLEAVEVGDRSIFDIEAERRDQATMAVPVLELDDDDEDDLFAAAGSGQEGFFDNLRSARTEGDEMFGPVDEDTDAALAAFFDQDEDEEDERWRRRFGPRR